MRPTPNPSSDVVPPSPEASGPKKPRLVENISALFLLQGLNYVLPLVTLPYLVRVLGFDRYGLLAFGQAFVQYFNLLVDYGFNFSATRQIAIVRDDATATGRVFGAVMAIKAAFAGIGFLVLAGIVFAVGRFRAEALVFLISYSAVVGNVLFPLWYFQGVERMRHIAVLNGVARLLTTAALFAFVHRPADYLIAAGLQAGAALIAGILGLAMVVGIWGVRCAIPTLAECATQLRDGWHLFVATAAVSLYTTTSVFVVGLIGGDTQAGYFSVADKVARGVLGLFGPVQQAMYPHVSAMVARSRDEALAFLRRSLRWIGGLSLGLSLLLLAAAPIVILVVAGHLATPSIAVLRWLALLPFVAAVSNVQVQTMITFGMNRRFSQVAIAAGLLNLALAIPLTFVLGAKGPAIAVVVTETFGVLVMAIVLSRSGIDLWSMGRRAG